MALVVIIAFVWFVGFFLACVVYYAVYRDVFPSFGRVIAALFWPIGIPLDFIFVQRRGRGQR